MKKQSTCTGSCFQNTFVYFLLYIENSLNLRGGTHFTPTPPHPRISPCKVCNGNINAGGGTSPSLTHPLGGPLVRLYPLCFPQKFGPDRTLIVHQNLMGFMYIILQVPETRMGWAGEPGSSLKCNTSFLQ